MCAVDSEDDDIQAVDPSSTQCAIVTFERMGIQVYDVSYLCVLYQCLRMCVCVCVCVCVCACACVWTRTYAFFL